MFPVIFPGGFRHEPEVEQFRPGERIAGSVRIPWSAKVSASISRAGECLFRLNFPNPYKFPVISARIILLLHVTVCRDSNKLCAAELRERERLRLFRQTFAGAAYTRHIIRYLSIFRVPVPLCVNAPVSVVAEPSVSAPHTAAVRRSVRRLVRRYADGGEARLDRIENTQHC